ncbi:MAG: M48 family metallopeptidase [Gammaproteobacteria bacterium]|jgi:predicted Zn-dependent protease|nr:M48 family metallopeptidase [Gammaproteobacteria bacterium]MBT3724383.1 M48 family metallopeptidase [Gammaproteobacteria bacterium]MBT4075998.1 M48 family metallopeptidase [Gammaproteobacteria bacterium]MBT4196020.1 M48 family metallopeptidase [Gammaproteobacteria bacterium]MBT4449954.1 M48 family metallopeptidase [Gammaproteobacteria bacterium]
MNSSYFKTFITIIILFLLSACVTNIAGRKQIMLVSESNAIESSKQAYINTLEPFKKKGQLDSNPKMVQRVNSITAKLIKQAKLKRPETKNWQWSIKVIDDPKTVNAWCMAGGKMAIYTGLINQLKATDDEIAQVMGHEISHALANHTAERMSVAMASDLAVNLYKTTIGDSSGTTSLATAAAQVALKLPNSRTSESEADKIGIELAAKAGFNPNAAVTLWQKMSKVGGGNSLEFLSTHPSPANREKALKKMIPKMMPFYQSAK